jgi:hypothetical protein
MMESFLSLLAVVLIAFAALGIGRPLLDRLRLGELDCLTTVVWSLALGMLAAGGALGMLGLLGFLQEPVIGVLTLAAAFCGAGEAVSMQLPVWRDGRFHESQFPRDDAPELGDGPNRALVRFAFGLAGVAALGSLVAALAPPTATESVCHQLELAKRFLMERRLVNLPDHPGASQNVFGELWFVWALALNGGVAAQLVHWGFGILSALAGVVLAKPIVGRRWAWIAGCTVLLIPGFSVVMGAGLSDTPNCCFVTLAMAAAMRAVDEGSKRWFIAAGLMLGAACQSGVAGLVFTAAILAVLIMVSVRRLEKRRLVLRGAAVSFVVAAALCSVWCARACWHGQLSEALASSSADLAALQSSVTGIEPGRSGLVFLSDPWPITKHSDKLSGRTFQLGPLFLLVLPGLIFARRLRGLNFLLSVTVAYGVLGMFCCPEFRLLLPVIPCLAVPVVWQFHELRRLPGLSRGLCAAVLGGVAFAGALAPWRDCGQKLAVVTGLETRASYLFRREPTFAAAVLTSEASGRDIHILSEEARAFYFNGRVTSEHVYRKRTSYDRQLATNGEFSRQLRAAGFTHLFLVEPSGAVSGQYDSTLSRLVDAELALGLKQLICLSDERFTDHDGTRRYRLIMVQ